jgi:UDP-N-acetylglucosamine--N-acetylmuramyl-(pentapeptide) pyrophosphoryl-undecaprenol N-acetylglucosamine transferase
MRDESTLTLVFAGGGSGGHLFPALAVDAAIREARPAAWIKYFCSDRKIDSAILDRAGVDFETVPSESSARWRTPWRIVVRNWRGYRMAKLRLKELQPDCVIGCGSFASVPTVLAARSLGIPILLLEQNVTPGRATRWLAKHADAICVSTTETEEFLPREMQRIHVTGNPVRPSIVRLRRAAPIAPGNAKQLLILGGSLGSQTLNAQVAPVLVSLPSELAEWRVVHQSGPEQVDALQAQYNAAGLDARVVPFLDSIEAEYARSDLVVCRSGATTVWELACLGLPAILIPFAGAKDDHQTHNARWFAQRGAAEIIDAQGAPQVTRSLSDSLRRLLALTEDRARLAAAMHALGRPQAADEIVHHLLEVVRVDQSSRSRPRK